MKSSSSLIVIRSYKIAQVTIDNLDMLVFKQIFQYLSEQFDLSSIQIKSSKLIFYGGIKLEDKQYLSPSSLDQKFENHLKHIIPPSLDYQVMSGYEIDLDFIQTISELNGYLYTERNYHLVLGLYDLSVIHNHSNILKILLEPLESSIYFSSDRDSVGKLQYYLTLKLSSENKDKLQQYFSQLSINLKNSPYISGKIYRYSLADIKSQSGLFSLGINKHHLEKPIFFHLTELIPELIPSPTLLKIPEPLPEVDIIEDLDNQESSEEIIENDEELTKIDLQLSSRIYDEGWQKVASFQSPIFSVDTYQNCNVKINFVYNLSDLALSPESLDFTFSTFVFLITDNIINNQEIHSDWVLLPDYLLEDFLLIL